VKSARIAPINPKHQDNHNMQEQVQKIKFKSSPITTTPASQQTLDRAMTLFEMPFMDLIWQAQQVHREHFVAGEIQRSTLLSVKTGGCSEDCGYCSQSAHHDTKLERKPLMPVEDVVAAARIAKEKGASRFCMGAAWRSPRDQDLETVADMIQKVKALGLETCVTLGMLKIGQAQKLKDAGLDYYNHNLDTDADFYPKVISTHSHDDRLDTLDQVRDAGIKVCSGGIVGMGETRRHRAGLLVQLANLPKPPESVPINNLVRVAGSPLGEEQEIDNFEFIRTIAVARILMPGSFVRLSAGRQNMSDEMQSICFLAGANSIFYGDDLLTTGNATMDQDDALFQKLGLKSV
jgi:biotin synthase